MPSISGYEWLGDVNDELSGEKDQKAKDDEILKKFVKKL